MPDTTVLPRDTNQARGLAEYALRFVHRRDDAIAPRVWELVERFHTDSVACAVAALAEGAAAPVILRDEAWDYPAAAWAHGARLFGSDRLVQPEKAVVANCAAVRELDANGTNFGIDPKTQRGAGEFGHNDFYPVALAAAQQVGWDGAGLLRAMLCLDEIRGRLAAVFSLKEHKIDHVVHGAIASAAVYGAVLGASPEQIESAIGLTVAHAIPFRAIRHGHQLSDSKGASAAISAEAAVLALRRALRGFRGPADIFRNPQAIFGLFGRPARRDESPFDLELTESGGQFAIADMHLKLGLYEHQSAGAIQGLLDLLAGHPALLERAEDLTRVRIVIYEPAYSIIGDPHKRDPRTRQSADHSMVYIIATLLRKALRLRRAGWRELMLLPDDYRDAALFDPLTRSLMQRIEFVHGGPEYDARYPEGIPTSLEIEHARLGRLSSGLVLFPLGHARNANPELADVLGHKFRALAGTGVEDVAGLERRLANLASQSTEEVRALYSFPCRIGSIAAA